MIVVYGVVAVSLLVLSITMGLRSGRKSQRFSEPSDLLRADDAQSQQMPTQAQITEEVEGMFWRGPRR